MATVQAGVKRSYEQMREARSNGRTLLPSQSREQSPKVSTLVRSTSATPDHGQGIDTSRPPERRPRKAAFGTFASIVLVGVRGTGKSSLGVIAASAYNYRLIESQRAFSDATGLSFASYRSSNGSAEFQRRNREVLERTLQTYAERAVIICGFSDLESGGASLLQDYAQAHPVIHVTRDTAGLHEYLRTWTVDRVNQLILASGSILRTCSNFEFFNLGDESQNQERSETRHTGERDRKSQGKYLTLKRVERDFLRLLRNVVGDHGRSIAHHSAYPLSQIEVDKRSHTFAVRLDSNEILNGNVDLEAAQTGVDCVELIVPLCGVDKQKHLHDIAHAFSTVRRTSILPIWLSIAPGDGSEKDKTEAVYALTSYFLSLGPELSSADLQLDDMQLQALISSKASTKIVASAHFNGRPAEGWNDRACIGAYQRGARLGCDIVKVTMPASPVWDSFDSKLFSARMRDLGHRTRLIAYEEGADGRSSKCFSDILTSVEPPVSAKALQREQERDRSDITARSITEALFASFIMEPLRFYIYGRDVSYSLSPAMSNTAYAACGMKHELTTFDCNDLEGFRNLVRQVDFGGVAMLQPFKTAVMPLIDSVSSHARAIGAVNTVIPIRALGENGTMPEEIDIIRQRNRQGPLLGLYGTNTDWIGIRSCVRRGLSPANGIRPASTGLVCGAGGMARAAIHSLASLGCQSIFVCNRTPANAHNLARHYNSIVEVGGVPEVGTNNTNNTRVQVIESFEDSWPSNARQPTMIVCCIPADSADGTPIDFTLPPAWLKSPTGGVVVEIAYKRPFTPLISQIRALADQGWILHDGFDVLPEQAYAQFEMFTGRRAPRKLMKDQVLKHYHAMTAAEANG